MSIVAIDLGGSRIKIGLIDQGDIHSFSIHPIPEGYDMNACMQLMESVIDQIINPSVQAIGIAYPGFVNPKTGKIIGTNQKYTDAGLINFQQWARERYQLPLVLENDANAALLGEINYGCGNHCSNAVMMILGTGVGTAAVMDGRLIRGVHNQAGCMGGHFPIEIDGRLCSCGRYGCVEANASTWAVKKMIQEHPSYNISPIGQEKELNFEVLINYVKENDAVANDIFNHCVKSWGNGIVTMIHAYDPELIILSGGIIKSGDILIKPLQEYILTHIWTLWGNPIIKTADNGEHSVLLGMAYLAATTISTSCNG